MFDELHSGPPSSPGRSREFLATGAGSVCVFRIDDSRYAIDATLVTEVFSTARVAFVPMRPWWLLGLHNLRGTPLAVVELRAFLDPNANGRKQRGALTVLALERRDLHVGARVDRVEAVRDRSAVLESPVQGDGLISKFIRFADEEEPVGLLDPDELFSRLQATRTPTSQSPTPSVLP